MGETSPEPGHLPPADATKRRLHSAHGLKPALSPPELQLPAGNPTESNAANNTGPYADSYAATTCNAQYDPKCTEHRRQHTHPAQ